ncbi:VanW family protein [Zhihengliuella sp.]|uniref:VanW family protein n=1 Tax=Zhihengliuella sp. TaxID=1954483 RepID=UPI002811627B|nr:VanW family protein [Zhihengliuella sp.]
MTSSKKKPSRTARGWIIGGSLAVLAVGGYIGAAAVLGGAVPRGTTVHGVPVGGMSHEQALERLSAELEPLAEEPIAVTAGDAEATLDPAASGLGLDLEATIADYTGFTLDPVVLWRHVVGGGELAPVADIDRPKLESAIADAAEKLNREPVEGKLAYDGVTPVVTEPVEGLQVAQSAASGTVAERWFDPAGPIELPTTPTPPEIVGTAFKEAAENLAEPLVAGPITVQAGDLVAEVSPEALAAAAQFETEDGSVTLALDSEKLLASVREANPDLGVDAQDARITLKRGKPAIVPHQTGRQVNPEGLGEKVVAASTTEERTVSVEVVETQPEFTTADAEALGVKEVVVDFSTPYPTYDSVRTKNLVAGSQKLTGVVVKPGETFSLLGVLSPITKENGYFESGVVEDGFSSTAVGGGLSQISTQMFNVGWLAGFDDVEHRPHSRWFDRYPAGREATLWEGQIDMKWRNNTDTAVMIHSWVADGRVHTRLWGTKHWTVTSKTSDHYNLVEPETKYNEADECVPERGGQPGFTVDVTRTRTSAEETLPPDTLRWTYQPWHKVVCGPPPGD